MRRRSLGVRIYGGSARELRRAAESFLRACARSGLRGSGVGPLTGGLLRLGVGTAPDALFPEPADVGVPLHAGAVDPVAGDTRRLDLPFDRLVPDRALDPFAAAGALAQVAGLARRAEGEGDDDSAWRAGHDYARANFPDLGLEVELSAERFAVLGGTEAAALGLALSGCRSFVSPDPGSAMAGALRSLSKRGLHALSIETAGDALCAAHTALGAGYAGVRAAAEVPASDTRMVFEAAAWGASAEVPAVFLLSEPACADGFPGPVLSPSSLEEIPVSLCDAFDLAEGFHRPVGLLAEPALLSSIGTAADRALSRGSAAEASVLRRGAAGPPEERAPVRGPWAGDAGPGTFDRYRAVAGGVSPRAVPGHPGRCHMTRPVEAESGRRRRSRLWKLQQKEDSLEAALRQGDPEGGEAPEAAVVAAGAACAALRPALARLNAEEGRDIALLPVRCRKPARVPAPGGGAAPGGGRRIVAVLDPREQLARSLEGETPVLALSDPADPGRVLEELKEVLADG